MVFPVYEPVYENSYRKHCLMISLLRASHLQRMLLATKTPLTAILLHEYFCFRIFHPIYVAGHQIVQPCLLLRRTRAKMFYLKTNRSIGTKQTSTHRDHNQLDSLYAIDTNIVDLCLHSHSVILISAQYWCM